MTITRSQNPMTADPGARTGVFAAPAELDLITADGLDEQGRDAIGRHARLLLLDLTGLSFCDARRLGALVRIANNADVARCRYAHIAPQSAPGEDAADRRPEQAAGCPRSQASATRWLTSRHSQLGKPFRASPWPTVRPHLDD